ncbi:MAG: PEP-CTERM sorting domain-containing protein [Phycisphaerae bacterium]|nr:PEP-CTERM sorting domain-containing protein [Phycisphaerae bacterium]
MKVAKLLLAIAVVAMFTSTASAHNYVWWEATDGVATYGELGQMLTLPCPGTYEVSMWLKSDEVLYAWASDLTSNIAGCPLISDFDYDLWVKPGKTGYYYPFGTVNWGVVTGPGFITNADGATLAGAPASADSYYPNGYKLCHFTLECTPDCCGAVLTSSTGTGGWGATSPNFMVQFGDNDALNPRLVGTVHGPVIMCIPEPATLVLLGFGGLALLRRR